MKYPTQVRSGIFVALAGIIVSVIFLMIGPHHPNLLTVIFKPSLFLSDLSIHVIFPLEGVAPSRIEVQVFNWLFVIYNGMFGFLIGVLGARLFREKSLP